MNSKSLKFCWIVMSLKQSHEQQANYIRTNISSIFSLIWHQSHFLFSLLVFCFSFLLIIVSAIFDLFNLRSFSCLMFLDFYFFKIISIDKTSQVEHSYLNHCLFTCEQKNWLAHMEMRRVYFMDHDKTRSIQISDESILIYTNSSQYKIILF